MGNKSSKNTNNNSSSNNNNNNNNNGNKTPLATASPLYTTLEQTDEDLAWSYQQEYNREMGRDTTAFFGNTVPPPSRRPLPPPPPPPTYSYGTWYTFFHFLKTIIKLFDYQIINK